MKPKQPHNTLANWLMHSFSATHHHWHLWPEPVLYLREIRESNQFPDYGWTSTADTWSGWGLQFPRKQHTLQHHSATYFHGCSVWSMSRNWNLAINHLHWITCLSVLQFLTSDSVRARLDMLLLDSINNWVLADLSLACNFPLTTTSKMCKLYIYAAWID